MSYKIQRNAKLPEGIKAKKARKVRSSYESEYRLHELRVTDAVTIPGRDVHSLRSVIRSAKRNGVTINGRTVETKTGFAAKLYRIA